MTASTANKALANKIMAWAWQQGIHVTRAQVLRDLPTWATRYNTATAPDRPLTAGQAADALGVQPATVVRYLKTGRLARLAGGVSARSVDAYRTRRDAGAARFPGRVVWTRQGAVPARRAA